MKVVNSEQMRAIDQRATSEFGVPSLILMENAALAVADVIAARYPDAERVTLFCGTGQNGGDGFAVARHLFNRHVTPHIVLVGDRGKVSGDAATNLEICRRMRISISEVADHDALDRALVQAFDADLIVDAIFGTGLTRPAEGFFAELIESLRAIRVPVVAVDVPSGIDASRSAVQEPAVRADVTVTFALPKIAHLFEPAASLCGEVVVADISIPEAAVAQENVRLSLLTASEVAELFPRRGNDTHKGTYGHAALVCGSEGRSGAAILAARGAIRSGAGLVTVLTDRETARLVDTASIESMTKAIDLAATREVESLLAARDAVLIGPGLADDAESYRSVRKLLARIEKPVVIDASALNALEGELAILGSIHAPKVITPHPGELARLMGTTSEEVNGDRTRFATEAAAAAKAVVVLKGHRTLIATPDGEVFVNPTGNPGMASGGMGDVLAGIIVALLARGVAPVDAACAGVFIHGFAGDLLAEEQSDTGLAALDLAERIPAAIRRLREDR
jgi:hydroxyethylthiazole kinase-like uncharacterized protein yjeF